MTRSSVCGRPNPAKQESDSGINPDARDRTGQRPTVLLRIRIEQLLDVSQWSVANKAVELWSLFCSFVRAFAPFRNPDSCKSELLHITHKRSKSGFIVSSATAHPDFSGSLELTQS